MGQHRTRWRARAPSWRERKRALQALLKRVGGPGLSYVEAVEGDGAKVYAEACKLGLEGFVSKRVDSAYRPGAADVWRKIRCAIVETVTVVGFIGEKRIEALHVARTVRIELVAAGRIEHGMTARDIAQLEALLRPLVIGKSPLLPKPARAIPVMPGVVVDISHRGVTAGGVMRHPRLRKAPKGRLRGQD